MAEKPKQHSIKARKRGEVRECRRQQIAAGVVHGKPVKQIADELGISREHCSRELNRPETQELIRCWMEPHHAAIRRMIPRALAAVNKGLKPSQDIRDRLAAVKTLGAVMQWAEGKRGEDDGDNATRKFSGTLEDLLTLYRAVTAQTAPE